MVVLCARRRDTFLIDARAVFPAIDAARGIFSAAVIGVVWETTIAIAIADQVIIRFALRNPANTIAAKYFARMSLGRRIAGRRA